MVVTLDDLVESAVYAERPGVLLDFDGTIAEIVPTPADARPLPGIRELLVSLATKMATAAVIQPSRLLPAKRAR